MTQLLRIGTRGSQLALTQTGMVARLLRAAHPGLEVEVVEIKTSGDWKPADGETRLSAAAGGKGLFAKEIEQAILEGRVDCGVHSLKDMPSFLPEGLVIEHVLPREDARDAFLSNEFASIDALPPGAVVGTSSMRRQAFLLARRPDLKIVPLRGNVPTRIEKLRDGQVDATLLALAGLNRLGLSHEIASVIPVEEMTPAAGQGIVGIEIRADDARARNLFDAIHCRGTGLRAAAERAALAALDGSCHTPIGAHAVLEGENMHLDIVVASPDGTEIYREVCTRVAANDDDAALMGRQAGEALKKRLPEGFLL